MKTKQAVVLFLTTLTLSLPAADSTVRLRFPVTGFSIAPLEVAPGDKPSQALIMFLPANGNFAGNVNVQIQPYSGTIEEYMELSLKQFKNTGLKVIEQKKAGKSGVVFEYNGELQSRALHGTSEPKKRAAAFTSLLARRRRKTGRDRAPSSRAAWTAFGAMATNPSRHRMQPRRILERIIRPITNIRHL